MPCDYTPPSCLPSECCPPLPTSFTLTVKGMSEERAEALRQAFEREYGLPVELADDDDLFPPEPLIVEG